MQNYLQLEPERASNRKENLMILLTESDFGVGQRRLKIEFFLGGSNLKFLFDINIFFIFFLKIYIII
jgi:hypothetical protein